MADLLSIAIKGNTEIQQKLETLSPRVADAGCEAGTEYIAQSFNQYATNAPYNYTPYSAVGGFYSDRQRAFVMAGIRQGTIPIPYPRSTADHFQKEGAGRAAKVVSDKPSMFYSMADTGQARLQALRGWGKVGEVLSAITPDVVHAFELGVQDALTNLGREFSEYMAGGGFGL